MSPLPLAPAQRRAQCAQCLRPSSTCYCPLLQPVSSSIELLILQHPLEQGHAKNTARLLHLCLPGSRLEVGEQFSSTQLTQWLAAGNKHSLLLYPASPSNPQLPLQTPAALPPQWLPQPKHLRLVLLDATWRKSRKMLYANPTLQSLPRWGLDAGQTSAYHIRKAQQAHQLSSFEAASLALEQLGAWPQGGNQPALLRQVFTQWLAWHQQCSQPR